MRNSFVQLWSGNYYYYARQDNVILIEDVAEHLGKICRFAGGTQVFYSVAQHSMLVEYILKQRGFSPRVRKRGLLHDAHETTINDLVTPAQDVINAKVKAHIKKTYGAEDDYDAISELKEDIDRNLYTNFGLSPTMTALEKAAIKWADMTAFVTEATQLLGDVPEWIGKFDDFPPADVRIFAQPWETATRDFLRTYNEIEAEIVSLGDDNNEDPIQPVRVSA